jgi:hypothetical protein
MFKVTLEHIENRINEMLREQQKTHQFVSENICGYTVNLYVRGGFTVSTSTLGTLLEDTSGLNAAAWIFNHQ